MTEVNDLQSRGLFDKPGNPYCDQYVFELNKGLPDPETLNECADIFLKATQHRLREDVHPFHLLQYGPGVGILNYTEQVASFLSREYGDVVRRENLIATGGATHGLWLVTTVLLQQGATVFVEDPTYFFALEFFTKDSNIRVMPVPLSEDGIDTDALEKAIQEKMTCGNPAAKVSTAFWGMVYVITVFQNPTGICYTSACCDRLVQMARKYNLLVVCDDVYNLLYYGQKEKPPSRLFIHDRPSDQDYKGNVISNGSFSKILCPGVRLGWLETPPRLMKLLKHSGIVNSGSSVTNYAAGIMASVLQLGYQTTHLHNLVNQYKERMEAVCFKLKQCLPEGCSIHVPDGGFFVWLQLPTSVNVARFLPWCMEKYKVTANPGQCFSVNKSFKNYMRLAISFYSREKLERAVEGICQALVDYMQSKSKNKEEARKER